MFEEKIQRCFELIDINIGDVPYLFWQRIKQFCAKTSNGLLLRFVQVGGCRGQFVDKTCATTSCVDVALELDTAVVCVGKIWNLTLLTFSRLV